MTRSQKLLVGFFSFAGIMHFVRPRSYEATVPPWVPLHREAVIVSGIAEIAGAVAVAYVPTRALARWWLLALLVAVFPANVYMAVSPEQIRGLDLDQIPRWMLWARLPLQPLMMLWVVRATERR
jgi:uncharacterized membrane protein